MFFWACLIKATIIRCTLWNFYIVFMHEYIVHETYHIYRMLHCIFVPNPNPKFPTCKNRRFSPYCTCHYSPNLYNLVMIFSQSEVGYTLILKLQRTFTFIHNPKILTFLPAKTIICIIRIISAF